MRQNSQRAALWFWSYDQSLVDGVVSLLLCDWRDEILGRVTRPAPAGVGPKGRSKQAR
jgi:hypothetical protein